METDRTKWNQRFASEHFFLGRTPSPFLRQEIERITALAPGTAALDIACGEGRNSIFLAQHGFRVTALDISDVGIQTGREWAASSGISVDFIQTDLDSYHFTERYDVILNFNYLLRRLIPEEVSALTPGGLLLFDTILESPELMEGHNPDFFLRHGELRQIFEAFDGEILCDQELTGNGTPTARLLFKKNVKPL